MLPTNGGAAADIDVYEDTCGFVTYVINPIRGASSNESRNIGWMTFSITYTFSGLKRPGANLKNPQSKYCAAELEAMEEIDAEKRKNERFNREMADVPGFSSVISDSVNLAIMDLLP